MEGAAPDQDDGDELQQVFAKRRNVRGHERRTDDIEAQAVGDEPAEGDEDDVDGQREMLEDARVSLQH